MRTEDDLRRLFDDTANSITADSVPTLAGQDQLLATNRKTLAPRRRTLILAAAGVVAVTVVGYAVVAGHTAANRIAGSPAGPAWTTSLIVPAGWEPEMRSLSRDGTESLGMRPMGGADDEHCGVTVSLREPSDRLIFPRSVQIGAQTAHIGQVQTDEDPAYSIVRMNPAPDRWVDASCTGDDHDATEATRMAGMLQFGESGVRLPVSLAHLPGGLAANEVYIQNDMYGPGEAPRVMMMLSTGLGPSLQPSLDPETAKTNGIKTVFAAVQSTKDRSPENPTEDGVRLPSINGREARLLETKDGPNKSVTVRDLVVVDSDYELLLNSSDYTADELVAIARAMQLGHPLNQEANWYPALAALGNK